MGKSTGIYKICLPDGKLELLQKFQTDFKDTEPGSNYCRWSRDNTLLAVGGEDMTIRVYKVTDKTFKEPFELLYELPSSHHQPINALDLSAGKSLLISTGNDCMASIFNL